MTQSKDESREFKTLDLDLIDRPDEIARLQISQKEIDELAASIAERGLRQPIEVAERDGRYVIVYGDRRFLACKKLGHHTILARVVKLTDKEIAIDRAIENLQRVNLSPIEEALQYVRMNQDLDMTWEQIGEKVGQSPGVVKRRVTLLQFPENIKEALHQGTIGVSVAEQLVRISEVSTRDYYLSMAIEHGVTLRVMKMWADDWEKAQRQKALGDSRGGLPTAPEMDKAVYLTCELCNGPEEVTKCRSVTVCQTCLKELQRLMRGIET